MQYRILAMLYSMGILHFCPLGEPIGSHSSLEISTPQLKSFLFNAASEHSNSLLMTEW
jgi:hypothetical protein